MFSYDDDNPSKRIQEMMLNEETGEYYVNHAVYEQLCAIGESLDDELDSALTVIYQIEHELEMLRQLTRDYKYEHDILADDGNSTYRVRRCREALRHLRAHVSKLYEEECSARPVDYD